MKTDEELMREYREGSEAAFTLLYEKYSSMVYGFIKKRLRDSEVDDVFQKVWRKLHEKKYLYQDQPFAPWFFVLIKHLVIDEYRSLSRKNLKPIQHEIVGKMYSEKMEAEDVEEFIRHLPEDIRQLVRKYYLDEVSYEDLEIETGLSQTNLRQRLSRAVRSLRKKVHEE